MGPWRIEHTCAWQLIGAIALISVLHCAPILAGGHDQQRDDDQEAISLEGLDYVVAEEDFPKIVDLLDLTDAQAVAARESYEVYLAQVAEVARSIRDEFEATMEQVRPMSRQAQRALRNSENADWQAIAA